MDARTVDLLMKDPNLNITRTKGTGNRFCFVNHVTVDPFTNKDLRLALKYGIDREKPLSSRSTAAMRSRAMIIRSMP
jgi:peptide/nickel transport system substrate-binding protein